jgi:aldose 1-epimerase
VRHCSKNNYQVQAKFIKKSITGVQELTATTGPVKLYALTNKRGTQLTACNVGAAVVSLHVKNKQQQLTDVVLGYSDAAAYLDDTYYIGSVVGRYANRIFGEKVMINDSPYYLNTRPGGVHQHGGHSGFNKKIFTALPFQLPNKVGIVFRYTSPHLEEGFPGELQLEVTYTLDDKDAWTVEYRAISSRATLVNFTQHSYFNLVGNPADTVDDHLLCIKGQYYLPVNQLQVPTGELRPVANTVFDFLQYKPIGKEVAAADEQIQVSKGYDHTFVLERQHSRQLKHAATVIAPATGIQLDVHTTEPAVHFYSGNFLSNVPGKNGVLYNSRSGFCLKTQHFPDAPNKPHFPSTILNAGEHFYSKTIFSFSIQQ